MSEYISSMMDGLSLQSSSSSLQKQGSCDQESKSDDLISQMPDDVLVMVLSFLPAFKDAVITSVLSKRWRLLWRKLIRLNFDGSDIFANMTGLNTYRLLFISEQKKYIDQVNTVINSFNHPIIQDFRIHFYLENRVKGIINEWVQFARNKKVEFLELNLTKNDGSTCLWDENYDFPSRLLDANGVRGLVYLKQLILKRVNISDTILNELIINAPHLETLTIHRSKYLKHIRISGRVLNLKHFEIAECCLVESICLSDFDLESFTYNGLRPIDLRLDHLPKLKEVELGQGVAKIYNQYFGQISSCASSLRALSMWIQSPMASLKLNSVPMLPNVKKLRVNICDCDETCCQDLYTIANACLNLETFTIEARSPSPINNRVRTKHVPYHPHDHLKLLKFVCYDRIGDFELEIAACIIQNAVALNKILIDHRWPQQTKPYLDHRAFTIRQLQSMIPRGVELVILN